MSAGRSEAKKIREEVLETRQMDLPFRMPLQVVGSLDKRIHGIHEIDLNEEPKDAIEANRDLAETKDELVEKVRALGKELLRLTKEKEAAEKRAEEAEARAEEAKKEASIDDLTKLHTKKAYTEKIEFVMDQTLRLKSRVSVIMLDVDHFKNVNDTYGHPVGDVILKKVADIVKKSLNRKTDFAARYGGEEIVLVLPDTDGKGSVEVAEKIRKAVEEESWTEAENSKTKGKDTFHVTISAGCATFDLQKEKLIEAQWKEELERGIHDPGSEKSLAQIKELNSSSNEPKTILTHADKALYAVKHSTRNAVRLYNGEANLDTSK